MKKFFKHIGVMLGLILLLSLTIPLLPVFVTPVAATVGYTSANITGTIYWMSYEGEVLTWTEIVNKPIANTTTSGEIGWWCHNTSPNYTVNRRNIIRWDLSAIPAGAEVTSMRIHTLLNRDAGSSAAFWLDSYYLITDMEVTGATPDVSEWGWQKSHKLMLTPPKVWTTFAVGAAWYIWDVSSSAMDEILDCDSGNYTWSSMLTAFDYYDVDPGYHSLQKQLLNLSQMYLEVTYATPAATRTTNVLVNAADYAGVIYGTENVTGVSWLSPRAAFNDEKLGFRIEGNPGATFSYELYDASGVSLDTGNNTIKVNNYYYWYYEPEISYENWVKLKVRQTNNSVDYYSNWGRIEPAPSATQRLMTVSAYDTEYPQFDNELSSYVIYKNGVGYLYWKTNLEAGDMANYHIKMMVGGDQSKTVYSSNMSTLNTDYFMTTDTNNLFLAHWRYLIFTPIVTASGYNYYDGMIINVNRDYTLSNAGFWQGTIRKNSDNVTLTWTDTAHFYLNDVTQGVTIAISDKVSDDGLLNATITVGEPSKVASRIANLNVLVLDDTGTIYGTTDSFVLTGVNEITFPQPTVAGEYQARFTFSDSTLVPDYTYIHDVSFTLAAGTAGTIVPGPPTSSGFLAWLNALLKSKGMDNTAGHWIIIIFLCVLIAAIFGVYGKMPLVATVIDILIFGVAIYIGWIDTWIIALLAIAAGFTLYRLFKKNTGEQKEV